jgi:hypothetical protein
VFEVCVCLSVCLSVCVSCVCLCVYLSVRPDHTVKGFFNCSKSNIFHRRPSILGTYLHHVTPITCARPHLPSSRSRSFANLGLWFKKKKNCNVFKGLCKSYCMGIGGIYVLLKHILFYLFLCSQNGLYLLR